MSLTSGLTRQPPATNSVLSHSSSSGWVGRCPCAPKLSGVGTIPRPKSCFQMRLTITRATRALAGESVRVSHRARSFRRPVVPANGELVVARASASVRLKTRKKPGRYLVARALLVAANQEVCRRGWTEIVKRLDLAPLAAPGGGRGDLGLEPCRGLFLGRAQARGDLLGLDGQCRGEFLGQVLLNR